MVLSSFDVGRSAMQIVSIEERDVYYISLTMIRRNNLLQRLFYLSCNYLDRGLPLVATVVHRNVLYASEQNISG